MLQNTSCLRDRRQVMPCIISLKKCRINARSKEEAARPVCVQTHTGRLQLWASGGL